MKARDSECNRRCSPGNWSVEAQREGGVRRDDVTEAQEAKHLRDESTRLQKLAEDLSLDKEI